MTTFRDHDGTIRLSGDLLMGGTTGQVATVQADGTVVPATAAGGTPESEHAQGVNVNIADAASAALTWTITLGPDSLLDMAAPAAPVVITAGWYVVSVTVGVSALTAGGFADIDLVLDPAGDGWIAYGAMVGPTIRACLTTSAHLDAGDALAVNVTNHDGAAARDFAISEASVLKLG